MVHFLTQPILSKWLTTFSTPIHVAASESLEVGRSVSHNHLPSTSSASHSHAHLSWLTLRGSPPLTLKPKCPHSLTITSYPNFSLNSIIPLHHYSMPLRPLGQRPLWTFLIHCLHPHHLPFYPTSVVSSCRTLFQILLIPFLFCPYLPLI